MRTEARLSLRCGDWKVAAAFEQVLAPDNMGIPRDQRFAMSRERRSLLFVIGSESPAPVLSTMSSILRDASLFQEIWLLSRGVDAGVGSHS